MVRFEVTYFFKQRDKSKHHTNRKQDRNVLFNIAFPKVVSYKMFINTRVFTIYICSGYFVVP